MYDPRQKKIIQNDVTIASDLLIYSPRAISRHSNTGRFYWILVTSRLSSEGNNNGLLLPSRIDYIRPPRCTHLPQTAKTANLHHAIMSSRHCPPDLPQIPQTDVDEKNIESRIIGGYYRSYRRVQCSHCVHDIQHKSHDRRHPKKSGSDLPMIRRNHQSCHGHRRDRACLCPPLPSCRGGKINTCWLFSAKGQGCGFHENEMRGGSGERRAERRKAGGAVSITPCFLKGTLNHLAAASQGPAAPACGERRRRCCCCCCCTIGTGSRIYE